MQVNARQYGDDAGPAEAGMPDTAYPVVDSAELNPVPRRLLRRRRREIHEIPRQPAGTVLVFQLGDSYEPVQSSALRLDDDIVVEAVAVAVVSMRRMLCEAVAYLPTADPRACLTVRGRFHCGVTDPQLVVETGCWDVQPFLTEHLVAERRLRFLATDLDPQTGWAAFHRNMTARLFAYHDLNPLVVPGLTARLVDLAVELQHLATPPRPRHGVESEASFGPTVAADGDGQPAFVPDNYTWGDEK